MVELVQYARKNGQRWRFALIDTDSITGMVVLERAKPDGEWVHVMDVCADPSELGIEVGIELNERDRVLNPVVALQKLASTVESYLESRRRP